MFCGKDRSAWIGCRRDSTAIGPSLQVLDGIDDPTTQLVVSGTSSVGTVFFQRAAGQAQKTRRFGRAQVAWRQGGEIRSHGVASVVVQDAADDQRRVMRTGAKKRWHGG